MGRRLKRLAGGVIDIVDLIRWALHERRKAKRKFPWRYMDG